MFLYSLCPYVSRGKWHKGKQPLKEQNKTCFFACTTMQRNQRPNAMRHSASVLTGTSPLSTWSRRCTSGVRSSTLKRMSYSSSVRVMACSVKPQFVVLPVVCGTQSVSLLTRFCYWGVSVFLVCGSGLCPIASISLPTPRFTMASA